jgi:hypothetical protein
MPRQKQSKLLTDQDRQGFETRLSQLEDTVLACGNVENVHKVPELLEKLKRIVKEIHGKMDSKNADMPSFVAFTLKSRYPILAARIQRLNKTIPKEKILKQNQAEFYKILRVRRSERAQTGLQTVSGPEASTSAQPTQVALPQATDIHPSQTARTSAPASDSQPGPVSLPSFREATEHLLSPEAKLRFGVPSTGHLATSGLHLDSNVLATNSGTTAFITGQPSGSSLGMQTDIPGQGSSPNRQRRQSPVAEQLSKLGHWKA